MHAFNDAPLQTDWSRIKISTVQVGLGSYLGARREGNGHTTMQRCTYGLYLHEKEVQQKTAGVSIRTLK